jgi:hypothetical protein
MRAFLLLFQYVCFNGRMKKAFVEKEKKWNQGGTEHDTSLGKVGKKYADMA